MALHLNETALAATVAARVGPLTKRQATEIAKAVRRQGRKVTSGGGGVNKDELPVRVYSHDDGTAAVVLAHPSGLAQQAKHGVLTRAAASLGLEVRS